jgi:hypothetical protein
MPEVFKKFDRDIPFFLLFIIQRINAIRNMYINLFTLLVANMSLCINSLH